MQLAIGLDSANGGPDPGSHNPNSNRIYNWNLIDIKCNLGLNCEHCHKRNRNCSHNCHRKRKHNPSPNRQVIQPADTMRSSIMSGSSESVMTHLKRDGPRWLYRGYSAACSRLALALTLTLSSFLPNLVFQQPLARSLLCLR